MGIKNSLIRQLIHELASDGKNAIQEAYKTKDYQNRTYNLHDSYGSAVYYNGVLQVDTIYYLSPNSTTAKKWYGTLMKGHDELIDFLQEYQGQKNGIELIIVAAMPYASILEEGSGGLKRKYKVISGAYSEMQSLQKKYKGSTIKRTSTSRVV